MADIKLPAKSGTRCIFGDVKLTGEPTNLHGVDSVSVVGAKWETFVK